LRIQDNAYHSMEFRAMSVHKVQSPPTKFS
jgi:hypothetical protein